MALEDLWRTQPVSIQTMADLPEKLKTLLNKSEQDFEQLRNNTRRMFNSAKREILEELRKVIKAVEKLKG